MNTRNIRILVAAFLLVPAMLLPLYGSSVKLPVTVLCAGSRELAAEIARTPSQLETGLMHRKEMAENEGMLFMFKAPKRASIYMRDTFIPLSCAFIDSKGIILEIREMIPGDETPVASVSSGVRFVLEVNRGWFERNGIGPGTPVRTKNSDLLSLF